MSAPRQHHYFGRGVEIGTEAPCMYCGLVRLNKYPHRYLINRLWVASAPSCPKELTNWNQGPPSCTTLAQPTGRRASSIACVYIAGPFSGSDGWEIKCNVHRAEELARQVAQLGAMPMTPHSIGANMAGTESQTFWLAATLEMMRRCDAVLFTDDWRRSAGARGEMAEAARLEMPVFYSVASLKRWLEGGNAPAMVAAIGKRDGGA